MRQFRTMQSITALVFILSTLLTAVVVVAGEANAYCEGSYKRGGPQCTKFGFNNVSDEEKCGDPTKAPTTDNDDGIVKSANCTTFYDISELPDQDMDERGSKMAQLITNVFENGDTSIGYSYIEDIGDCRGYTSGYIGFTTGTNDAYVVVKHYLKVRPSSPLKKSLKELERLTTFRFNDPRRAYVGALKKTGYAKAWKDAACTDSAFIQTQLDVGHAMYLKPALKYAASVDVHSNLGKAIFYDTIVQHGWQYVEPDINLPRILLLTGPRHKNESEKAYLGRFLTTRRELMCCSPSDVWSMAADRVADLQKLVADWDKNKDLKNPVRLEIYGVDIKGTEDMSFDKQNCDHKPTKGGVEPRDLPTPDTCPNPLM